MSEIVILVKGNTNWKWKANECYVTVNIYELYKRILIFAGGEAVRSIGRQSKRSRPGRAAAAAETCK